MKVELIYLSRGCERKKLITLEQLIGLMQGDNLRKRTEALSEAIHISKVVGSTGRLIAAEQLPVVNFSNASASDYRLVLLSFRVSDPTLLQRIMEKAKSIPQTVMAFIGLSGCSLKVVTALSYNRNQPNAEQQWADAAFLSAANFYGQALGVSPESHAQGQPMQCRIGYCPTVWLNTAFMAVPVFDVAQADNGRNQNDKPCETEFNDYSVLELQLAKFNYIFGQLSFEKKTDEQAYLCKLADRCRKAGIKEEIAVKSLLHNSYFKGKDYLVRSTFQTAYNDHPFGINTEINRKLASQYQLEAFMRQRYQLRRNQVTDVVEYREFGLYLLSWRPLDELALNTITRKAMREGINVWDKDVRRIVYSDDVVTYDPIRDYISQLPQWDGIDRLKLMAARVKTDDKLWEDNFRIWMRSMVSQWMGRNRMYGSSMVLMLTGPQGTGKSTFIRMLMPPELMAYYLDRLDFTTKKDAEKALTRFGLINIDEFDQISKSQTAYLKHLLQKSSVTQRKMYEDAYTQRRRYAVFAATTNCPQPLTDMTGSRRYMVEDVDGQIDVRVTGDHAVNYRQLYAQIVEEIHQGMPTYFDAERERLIQNHNLGFTVQDPLVEAFNVMYRKPVKDTTSPLRLSTTEIVTRIHRRFVGVRADKGNAARLGRYLTQQHYNHVSTHERWVYEIAEREV